jgi:hypothetical protein
LLTPFQTCTPISSFSPQNWLLFNSGRGPLLLPGRQVCSRRSLDGRRIPQGSACMAWTDLLPHFPALLVQAIQETGHQLMIPLVSTRLSARCPTGQTSTQATHGWFTRSIPRLPCSGRSVVCSIPARRFRCPHPACLRRTVREDLSGSGWPLSKTYPSGCPSFAQRGRAGGWPGWRAFRHRAAGAPQPLHAVARSHPPSRMPNERSTGGGW